MQQVNPFYIDTFCSERYRSLNALNFIIEHEQADNFVCTKLHDSNEVKYCDGNKDFINSLNNTGLICQ